MRKFLFCFLSLNIFLITDSLAQISTEHTIIHINNDICKYYKKPYFQTTKVQRHYNNSSKKNLNNPCSSFIVTYNGFTPEAQTAFEFAVNIWMNSLNSNVPIRVEANFGTMQDGQIGMATPSGYTALSGTNIPPNTIFPLALAEQILGYEIMQQGQPTTDINANFNNNINFYYGTDGNPGINQIDFVSVVLHELAHGLGFAGLATTTNNETQGAIRYGALYYTMYDYFIENGSNTSILSFADPSDALLSELTSNNLYCNGTETIEQNNFITPKIHAPTNFLTASSYNHWDEETFAPGDSNSLMTPGISPGESIHNPGLITLGLMQDMGWNICGSLLNVDNSHLEEFSISPNPFNSKIKIKIPSQFNGANYDISLFDINGRLLLNKKRKVVNQVIQLSELHNLENAIYFITLKNENTNSIFTKQIIKK